MSSPDPVTLFLASHQLTRCPTAAVAPTSATIPEADRQALAARYAERYPGGREAIRAAIHSLLRGMRRR